MVRSVGIDLLNSLEDSKNALQVIAAVKREFSGMPEIRTVPDRDVTPLDKQISYEEEHIKRIIGLCILGFSILIALLSG